MLRAVLDANVIISALIQPKGASGRIVASLLEENSFELVLSPAILAEIRRALTYPKVRKYIKVSDEDLDLAVAALVQDHFQGGALLMASLDRDFGDANHRLGQPDAPTQLGQGRRAW